MQNFLKALLHLWRAVIRLLVHRSHHMPDLTPAKVDTELTSRLGTIVMKWASAESWLSYLLATMVEANPGAMSVVTNEMSASLTIQIIKTLISVHEHKQPELSAVRELIEDADELRQQRNEYAHGVWNPEGCEPKTCLVNIVNWKRKEISRSVLVTVSDLDQLAIELDEWIAAYIDLGKRFGFPRRAGETQSIFFDK